MNHKLISLFFLLEFFFYRGFSQNGLTSVFNNYQGERKWVIYQNNYRALYQILYNEAARQLDKRSACIQTLLTGSSISDYFIWNGVRAIDFLETCKEVANGNIYQWNDGRSNYDTITAVFDYGDRPEKEPGNGFQVIYSSRQTNASGGTKEWYFSNGGKLDLETNMVNNDGGLTENHASTMGMKPFLLDTFELPQIAVETGSDTGSDSLTNAHMKNWMECVHNHNVKTNAPVEAGYSHSITDIMVTAALRTGQRSTFDTVTKQVMAGGKAFKY